MNELQSLIRSTDFKSVDEARLRKTLKTDPAWRFGSSKLFLESMNLVPTETLAHVSHTSSEQSFLVGAKLPHVVMGASTLTEDLSSALNQKGVRLQALQIQGGENLLAQAGFTADEISSGFLQTLGSANCREIFSLKVPAGLTDLSVGLLIEPLSRLLDNPYRSLLIEVGAGSTLNLFQEFVGNTGTTPLSLFLKLNEGARLNHVTFSASQAKASIYQSVRTVVAKDAHYSHKNLLCTPYSARTFHQEFSVDLCGENAFASLQAVTLSKVSSQIELFVRCNHKIGNTKSEQLYKAALAGGAKSFFRGEIEIAEGADLSSSQQLSQALLLDKTGQSITEPVLRISADDVEAAHGSTSGAVNGEELFYLESRAISRDEAMRLIVNGFLLEVIESIEFEPLRAWAKREVLT